MATASLGEWEISKLRSAVLPYLRRFAGIVMMVAAVAFTFQGTFVVASETRTGEAGHHHGFALSQLSKVAATNSHVRAHVHTDGTVHRHAVDDADATFDDHLNEPGCPCCWNMAIAVGVLPSPIFCSIARVPGSKLAMEMPDPYSSADPIRLRRPPRPASIA